MQISRALDHSLFRRTVQVLALRIPNAVTELVIRPLRDHSFRRPGTKIVFEDPGDATRRIFLLNEAFQSREALPQAVEEVVKSVDGVEVVWQSVELNESNFSLEELLRTVIPAELELPSAYEAVGHIAHLNLRQELLPYRKAIGEAILAKVKPIRTVVNKLKTIDAVYRTFDMELLAGEDNYDVELIECNCRFRFNFRKVYWNSRLQVEHKRIVDDCSPSDRICDMFAGVGPFAIPLAKKGCTVYANDLNPASYEALLENAQRNHVKSLKAYNMDAREIIRQLCADQTQFCFNVVIMNLPKDAVEFLDVFVGCMPNLADGAKLPTIYCYAFCKPESDDLTARVNRALDLGEEDPKINYEIRKVRDISPKKFMYCVKFTLPAFIATRSEAKLKKRKTDKNNEGNNNNDKMVVDDDDDDEMQGIVNRKH
jgi:tRNA (guanine37-N1)-methyltransferase